MAATGSERRVTRVIIEYADGTHEALKQFALVGFAGNTWHSVLLSPASSEGKVKMNNMLVELSTGLQK